MFCTICTFFKNLKYKMPHQTASIYSNLNCCQWVAKMVWCTICRLKSWSNKFTVNMITFKLHHGVPRSVYILDQKRNFCVVVLFRNTFSWPLSSTIDKYSYEAKMLVCLLFFNLFLLGLLKLSHIFHSNYSSLLIHGDLLQSLNY